MKIGTPWPHKKARIEIIPLIDIMFFLLASFMLASLSMMRLQSIKMNLPTAAVAKPGAKPEIINIDVDKLGRYSVEKQGYTYPELQHYLSNRYVLNTNVPVYINGDPDATHGMIIEVLDLARSVGIKNASFAIAATTPAKQ